MAYCWIEDIKKFEIIAHKWDEAILSSGNFNPFLLSDFIMTWFKHNQEINRLCIFVVYGDDNEKILGGIPLFLERRKFKYGFAKVLRYIGSNAANYTEPLYNASDIEILPILLDALAKRKDWDVLHLANVREKSQLIEEYQNSPANCKSLLYILQDHMDWAIDLTQGKGSFIASRPKKMIRDLRSKRKFASREYGQICLKEIKGRKDVEKYFDLYVKFSLSSFNRRNKKSTFSALNNKNFFREFLVIMDKKDRLDAHILLAGEKVLAISFGYRFGKGFNWILTGFNYEYKYIRPGYLLIEELINEIVNRGETYYNWYGHPKFYKVQWCNMCSPLYQFFVVSPNYRGRLYKIIEHSKSSLKSNTKFMNLYHKTEKMINKFKALSRN